MKVLFVFSLGRYDGGAAVVWLNLIDALRERGVEPFVVLPSCADKTMAAQLEQRGISYEVQFFTWWVTDDKRPHSLKRKVARAGARMVNARAERVIENIIKRQGIDAVYVCDGTIEAGIRAAQACGVPAVWHFHQVVGEGGVEFIEQAAYVGRQLGRASQIVAVSEAAAENLRVRFSFDAPIAVIPNGVAPAHVGTHAVPLFSGETVTFTLAARFDSNKGQRDAIDAFAAVVARFPQARLQLVGTGKDELVEELRTYAASLPCSDRIAFAGQRSDMARVWEETDVALNCSRSEGCSMVLLEALCSGCLVLASDAVGNREVLSRAAGLSYKAGNADALASQMRWALEHPQDARALANEGCAKAREAFTLEAQGAAVYELLRAAAKGRHA